MSEKAQKDEAAAPAGSPDRAAAAAFRASLAARERQHKPVPFLLSPEFKRMLLFVVAVMALGGAWLQHQWDKVKMKQELEKDRLAWEEKQKAVQAPPQPGAGSEGAVVRWDNMLAQEVDDASLDDVVTDRGFQAIVRHLAHQKEGEGLKPDGDFDYVELLRNPAKHRGTVVSLSGLVNKVYSNIRLESNQGPYDCVYRLYLVDLSGTEGAIVDVLVRPDGIEERQGVEAEAVFIRTHKYESKDGKPVRVPYLIAKEVRKIQRQGRGSIWSVKTTVIVIASLSVLALLILLSGRSGKPGRKPETNATSA